MNKIKTPAASSQPSAVRVAYHDGPPNITFYNIAWARGVPQEVTPEQWAAMRARGDFAEFAFRAAGEAPHHPSPITHHEE